MISSAKYASLEDFINDIRSRGRYSFALEELKSKFDQSDKAINQGLFRLKNKKKIAQIRKGYYAILSPEFSKQQMVPPYLFIDDLMHALKKNYYVGLLSAAALYGAAHHQPMEYFVIVKKPALRDIKSKKLKINFFVKKQWDMGHIIQKKTDAGYINVSSPELTALDLLYYLDSIGLNHAFHVLKELASELNPVKLAEVAKNYNQITAIQRLGFLLDELQEHRLTEQLFKELEIKKYFPIPLSLNKQKEGTVDNRWKVIPNIQIDKEA